MEILLGALGITLVTGFFYYENNGISTTNYEVDCGIGKDVNVVHLSDLHGKEFGKNNEKLKRLILKEKPDLVVATGDMIDSSLKNMEGVIDFLSDLSKCVKVVYISGNNEQRCKKAVYIFESLKSKGVIVLRNEIITLSLSGVKVNILGMFEKPKGDLHSSLKKINGSYAYEDSHKLFKRLESLEGLKIVLSHYPELFEAEYSKYDFHIMFSGHAHGGQFRIPIIKRGLIAPGQGFFPKYTEGMHGNKNKLIISRGLGNSTKITRLFNRPEIVNVKIK
ncbi:metallophosphoesterase [Clostridium perfringens]|uniref:metallophosphoesterase n=1 Tax=Clostridium perfringens TaxID=1502 RepID=UPI002468BA93|nr:metallophosphoesterase [Clostridium perfringens]MDH5092515.1 putative metallophosphoesterase [Clostridium perfringens]MDT9336865.1 metallophosphoesterase [Clostridium perfringens]MDT9344621.1 metallophosphoesterase [Clostridium perfringens]MDT9347864.1 metallophosphoesterase [Clostridium perfringens]MDT9353672.1 metallophosphoesterase [Clostridium perfringens]